MSTELTIAAKVDASLTASVAKNVGKTVKLMCNKCEQALVLDDEASQVRNNFLIPLLSKAADFSERSLSEVVVQRHKGFSGSESPSPTICLPSVGVTDFPNRNRLIFFFNTRDDAHFFAF